MSDICRRGDTCSRIEPRAVSSTNNFSGSTMIVFNMDSSIAKFLTTSRRSLQRKTPSLSLYQSKPITKHYELNNQILKAFDSNYEQKYYDVAYALGIKFVETALLEIPKHGYFYSQRHERDRMQSAIDAVRVTQTLKELEEQGKVQVPPAAHFRVDRLTLLAMEEVEQASNDQASTASDMGRSYELLRAQTEAELKQHEKDDDSWVCEPFLAFAESLSGFSLAPSECCDRQQSAQSSYQPVPSPQSTKRLSLIEDDFVPPRPVPPPSDPLSLATASRVRSLSLSSREAPTKHEHKHTRILPLGLDPPGLIRSKQSMASVESTESELEKALFLSGLEVSLLNIPPPTESMSELLIDTQFSKSQESPSGMRKSQILQLKTLCSLYHEDFDALSEEGRMWISYVDTYQGRLAASTNGCTIIAPLLCIHHLIEVGNSLPYSGISDFDIEQAIDEETPVILTQLRHELGLSEHAFLIPSDAHDYLIKNGQLSDKQFLTVLGGNVLDDSHLKAFVDVLRDDDQKYKKMAATFYFHEHVISILQMRRSPTVTWYDVIDSLPSKDFMKRSDETNNEFHARFGLDLSEEELFHSTLRKTARIRCVNADALTTCLRWYACSKFTDENIKYIDQYAWDENSCDFDPRVFQGFVWIDHPQ